MGVEQIRGQAFEILSIFVRNLELDLLLMVVEFHISCSPDRESSHFSWINIVLIDKWRVFIGHVGAFLLFEGLHLTPADLVVDGKSDAPSVFELVEWILIRVHDVGFQEDADIGNRFAIIRIAASLGETLAHAEISEDLESPGWVSAMPQPDVHMALHQRLGT